MIWFDQRRSSISSDTKLVLCLTVCEKKRKIINGGGKEKEDDYVGGGDGDGDDYDVYNKNPQYLKFLSLGFSDYVRLFAKLETIHYCS